MKWILASALAAAAVVKAQVFQPVAISNATVYSQTSTITAPAGTVVTVTVGASTFATFTVPANQNFTGTLTLKGSAQ